MLLANSCVSGKAATGHVLIVRSHRRLSPNTRSSSKIITPNRVPLIFGTNSGSADEPLMGGSFFVRNWEGIEALAKPIFVRGVSPFYGSGTAAPFNGRGTAAPFNGCGTAARSSHAGFASSLHGISHVRLAYLAPCFAAVLPLAGRLMGGQKGKCLGVAQYCVDYENSEYYCGHRRPAEEFGEEVRYRKNREENHRERVLREGFSQVAAQQRMEGAQGSAARAVEACQRVCRARRKNRRR